MARSSQFQRLISYLRPHSPMALQGVFALMLVNALAIAIPLEIRKALKELQVTFTMDSLIYHAGFVVVMASIMWAIRLFSRMRLFGVGRFVEFDLKQKIFEHLLRLEPSYFASNTIGDLINRATSIAGKIRGFET